MSDKRRFFYYTLDELKAEYFQVCMAETHDNVDTSLSTLKHRDKLIAEIEKEAEQRNIDLAEWQKELDNIETLELKLKEPHAFGIIPETSEGRKEYARLERELDKMRRNKNEQI